MTIAYVSKRLTSIAAAASLLSSLSLAGCASTGSSLMDARAELPPPQKSKNYLPVGDLPKPREKPAMTVEEQSKLQKELLAARDRQAIAAKSQGVPLEPMKP